MSMELHVLIAESRLPDRPQWQEEIDALGFDLKLDSSLLQLRESTGFLPCTLQRRKSGFEFCIWEATAISETNPELKEKFLGRDLSANFRWGGDLVEMACALIASAALAKLCDGVWFDPQEGVCLTSDEAIDQTKSGVALALG